MANSSLPRTVLRGSLPWAGFFAVAALALALALLIEGSRPASRLPLAPAWPHFDKLLHFGAHFALTALLFGAASLAPVGRARRRWKWAGAGAVLADFALGLGVEVVQFSAGAGHFDGLRTGRHFEWADVAANTAGALCAVLGLLVVVSAALRPYIKRRSGAAKPS